MADLRREHELRHLNFEGVARRRSRRRTGGRVAALRAPGSASAQRGEEPADRALDPFVEWVLIRAGLDPSIYRASPLKRRLPACLRALKVGTTEEAMERLACRPELCRVAVDSLLVGVTEFFRDPCVFESLGKVLPTLARDRGALRIWSVSCSVGCELYSVGILLSELGLLAGSDLLGSDCRAEAIGEARRGYYTETQLRGLVSGLRSRYFEVEENGYRVREPLRSQTRWRIQDVLQDWDSEDCDVILWRNTAIYLRSVAARSVWNRLAKSLRPGGLLVTGKAERPDCDMALKRLAGCLYQRPAS